MYKNYYMGWDIGGAHLKVAVLDQQATVIHIEQIETPLWKGIDVLDEAVASIPRTFIDAAVWHGITMTGELADIFPDRISGVTELVEKFRQLLSKKQHVYAANKGWVNSSSIEGCEIEIASTNWHATTTFVANQIESGLLIDIGSTTTDIIPIIDHAPESIGMTDSERMQQDELIYTGVNRTPVASVVSQVPFAGNWQQIATEYFSSMADIYCLTRDMPENASFSTADGGGTSMLDCARRLARVVGRDLYEAELSAWQQLASYIAMQHNQHISQAIYRVKSRYPGREMPIVGAGAGRFLIRLLAERQNYPYIDFADFLQGDERLKQAAAICAPATACAALHL